MTLDPRLFAGPPTLAETLFPAGWRLPLEQQLAAVLLVRVWPVHRGEFLAAMP